MGWVKLDDGFAEHPKLEKAGPLAGWLHVSALCYCARHLTDGRIPKTKALRLADVPKPAQLAARLVTVGLWEEDGDDYVIHDYGDFNPSRAKVVAEREAAAERQRRARESRDASRRDNGRSPEPSHAETSGVTHGVSPPSPSRPVPVPLAVTGQSVTSTAYGAPPDDDDREPAERDLVAARTSAAATPEEQRLIAAATVLGARDHERAVADGVVRARPGTPGAAKHRQRCIERRCGDEDLARLVIEQPDWTSAQLVDAVDGRRDDAAGPTLTLVRPLEPDPDCPYCEGTGIAVDDDGREFGCECRYRSAS